MAGIHDVFPANDDDSNEPISEKKLKQGDGRYATKKIILGFEFDGVNKRFGLRKQIGHTCLQSSRDGFAPAKWA